jgi:hypothetical protein
MPVIFPPGRARLETKRYGISYIDNDNRDPRRACLDRARRRRGDRNDQVDVLRHEVVSQRVKATTRGPPINHCDVGTLDVTELAQGLAEYLVDLAPSLREVANPPYLGDLCMRRERPCCRAAEERHELASSQMIELHASAALHNIELAGISQRMG